MSAPRSALGASIVSVADHAGDAIPAGHAKRLYEAADALDILVVRAEVALGDLEDLIDDAEAFTDPGAIALYADAARLLRAAIDTARAEQVQA